MKTGDGVRITNRKSVYHGQSGRIEQIDQNHHEGVYKRPIKVRLDSGSASWYQASELRKVRR